MKDTYYFSHDQNARNDPKIMAMMNNYKGQGYGWWWIIIEMLSEQSDRKLKRCNWVFNALAAAMMCDKDTAERFVCDCIDQFELLQSDGEFFWSNSLNRRLDVRDEKKKKKSEAGKKGAASRWNNGDVMPNEEPCNNKAITNESQKDSIAITTACQTHGNAITKDGKGKESKVNERKGNKTLYACDESLRKINDKSFELGMNGLPHEFVSDCEMWIQEGVEPDLIIRALSKAVDKSNNKSPPGRCSYAKAVIQAWIQDGVKSVQTLEVKSKPKQQIQQKAPQAANFEQRQYSEEFYNSLYE